MTQRRIRVTVTGQQSPRHVQYRRLYKHSKTIDLHAVSYVHPAVLRRQV